jgi:signal transduction histidine kinase
LQNFKSLPFLVLGISILITVLVWINFVNTENDLEKSKFQSNSNLLRQSIVDRLKQYEQILYGGKGLFVSSTSVEYDEWKSFVATQEIGERFEGIQGVGHIKHISNDAELTALVDSMHQIGITDFSVFPEGQRDEYYPIVFLEPLDFRNKRAVGYDVYFEDNRRNALDIALSTNTITITGKITLVQELDTDIQNGFLMYLPICSDLESIDSCQSSDLVYAVFRMDDFIGGIFERSEFQYTHLRIYDDTITESSLFFDSDKLLKHSFTSPTFSTSYDVLIGNRNWVFVFEGVPDSQSENIGLALIPIIGFSMGLLLFYVFLLIRKNLRLTEEIIKNEKISAMGTMASRLAHDLRNPLSVIKMCCELLIKPLSDSQDAKSKERLQQIIKSSNDISNTISDVLEFARTNELHYERVYLNSILNDVIKQRVVPSGIQISFLNTDVDIYCDKNKIHSVFANLISNSIDAIGDTGKIQVTTVSDSKNITITFEDSGPGIKPQDLPRIFDPLFTSKTGGTGLGLAICKSIVEQHGGKISVTNNPTRFIVVLPNRI